MEQNPNIPIETDSEENRQAYEQYLANYKPDTYTVTYGDQSYTYSADEVDRLKTAYRYMNADEAYSKKAYESYTNSDFDQFAMQNGLPSWKLWSDVEKYASGGGLKDNYGGVSSDQWKKINELWAKDWEYGLTDADAYRKANGLAPVSYDSMYGDTLLDAELKANGLPPSKLLNGELGDKYRSWASDSAKWTEFMDAVDRKYIEKTGSLEAEHNPLDVFGNYNRMTYTLDDALTETLNDPKWAEFANAHFGVRADVPDQYSDAYIMTEKDEFGNKYEVRDENGNLVYDTAAWDKDRQKATKNNLAIDADEFAITSDRMHEYYAENGQQTMALMAAEKAFASQGKTLNASNAQEFSNLWSDYYTGFSLNEGEGYTVDLLFPDANLSEEERAELQPFIDKANKLRVEHGYEASREYLVGGEFSRELKQMNDDKIVARYRNLGNTVKGSKYSAYKENPMTDDEILHEYYTSIGEPLGMTEDEILAMERGELSLSDYMREKCPNVESAEAFVNDRLTKELTDLNIPLTVEELETKWGDAYGNVQSYVDEIVFPYLNSMPEIEELNKTGRTTTVAVRDRVLCSEEEFNQYYKEHREWYNGLPFADPEEREKYLNYLQKEEDAVRGFREHIREIQPDFYDKADTYPPYNLAYARDKISAVQDERVSMLADAVSYTPEFEAKTADADFVNQRFDQIIAEDAKSSADLSDVVVYATDDEKRKLVFMSEQNPEDADTYLNKVLLHKWDDMAREDKRANTEMLDGGVVATIFSIFANPFESLYNFGADVLELVRGNEILSSQRATWSTDVQSRIAENISETWAGDVGAFLYQLIPSTVQSGVSMWLAAHTGGASEAFTLALMSTESYSSAVDQALQNGASSGEAFLIGLANGANEALFEHLSLESFLKQGKINTVVGEILASGKDLTNATVRKTFAKELGKRMLFHGLVEGSEELNTSLANLFAESLILGVNSSYNKSVERYVQAGLSREEAENRATEDVVKGVAMDFVGGLVSGAFMTVGNDLVDSRGGRVFIDRTGMTNFVSQTHNLSLVKTEDALDYAKKNLEKDANGLVTAESAQRVFDDLRKQGADAATLSRVRDSFSTAEQITANQGAQAVAQTAIREQRNEDGKKLVKAASQMIYNKVQNGKGTVKVSEAEIARVTNEYLDRLTGTVQAGDIRNIELASEAMRLGYIDDIKGLAGYDTIAGGMDSIAEYYNTLSAEDQTAIKENAKKYINAYNHAGITGAQAGRYANAAAILEHAVSNADSLNGLNSVFGSAASVSPQAVANACLNSDAKASMDYVNACCRALSVLQSQNGSHLFSAAQNNTNATAYVASQMALAASMPTDTSYARAMYDYVSKYGATPETMDLLTAANICESIGTEQTDIRRANGRLYTTEQIAQITREYNKALTNYNNKKAIAQAHEQADATERTEHEARIEKYRAQIEELQVMMNTSDSATLEALTGKFANATAEFQTAHGALETLIANQNQRNTQTKADLASAESAYNDAKEKYQNAMQEHAANYTQRMGDILESIKGKQKVSFAALRQANALVMYGTEENLNDIQQKIIAAEKTAAVALGRALGADVQCVKFDEAFLKERKIPKSKWANGKIARGMRDGGTIYLNESVMKPEVGSLTNEVLLHEIGHFLEESPDNYEKYKAFALKYMRARDGASADAFIKREGEDEMVAEFTRQVALADPRAVAALCKSAPKMSMRVFQWLTATNNRMSSVAVSQSRIVRDAQRAFAKGIKAVRSENANQTETTVEDATRGSAMRDAEKVLNEVVQYEEAQRTQSTQNVQTNTEQTSERAEEPKTESTERTDRAETETANSEDYEGYDVPTEVGKVETIKGDTELADGEFFEDEDGNRFVYDETGNLVRYNEQQTTETPAETVAETTEDFADVEVPRTDTRTPVAFDESVNSEYNNGERANATLPFALSSETRSKIMRVVSQMITQNADANGRVPASVNDNIAKIVEFQVKHDSNYTDTPEDVIASFAETFKAPQREETSTPRSSVEEYQRQLLNGNGTRAPSQFSIAKDPTADGAFADLQQEYRLPQFDTTYEPSEEQLHDPNWYVLPSTQEYWANHERYKDWKHRNLAYISAAAHHQVNIPYEVLMNIPEIRAAQDAVEEMTNGGKNSFADNKGNKERENLQDKWVYQLMGLEQIAEDGKAPYTYGSAVYYKVVDPQTGKEKTKVKYDGVVDKNKQAYIVLGRPAAGKSKVFADPYSARYNARIIDSDLVKEWTPEFKEKGGIAAGYVQAESADVAQRAIDFTTGYYEEIKDKNGKRIDFVRDANGNRIWHEGTNDNIVVPRVGGNSIAKFVEDLIDRGYSVTVLYNDLPQAKSIMRAMSRFAETDRYLDITYLHNDIAEDRFDNKAWNSFQSIAENKKVHYMEWRDNDVDFGEEAREWWNSNDGRSLAEARKFVENEAGRNDVVGVVSVDRGRAGGTGDNSQVREIERGISKGAPGSPQTYTEYDPVKLDAEYMPLAEKYLRGETTGDDEETMRVILDTFAMQKVPWTTDDNEPQLLYSAQKLGVNDFVPKNKDKDVNFATNHIGIADSYLYDRDNIYNPVRPHAVQIKDQYVLPDIANDENLIDNARRLLNEEYVPAESDYTEAERRESMQRHYDELANYANGVDLPEIVNLQEVLEHYLPDKTKDEIRQIADDFRAVRDAWHAAVIIRQNISDVFRLTSETSTDAEFVATWAQQLKALYNKMDKLFNEYDLGDDARLRKYETYIWSESLADYADELFKLTDDAMKFGGVGMFKNNSTGELLSRNELLNRMKQRKNKAVYQLYGFNGNQPIDMNAHGYDWDDLTHPDFEGYTPRKIFNDARNKVGATSMRVRNTVDMGGATYDEDISGDPTGDDLLFPAREALQLYKSADLVTLDENGNIIPPSQRFNLLKHDINWYTEYDYSKPFAEQLDDFENGKFPEQMSLMVGMTPSWWSEKLGLARLPIALDWNHVDYALNGTYKSDDENDVKNHIIPKETLKNLPNLLNDPIAIIRSRKDDRKVVVIIDGKAVTGKRIIIPMVIDGGAKIGKLSDGSYRYADVHYLSSIHGRDNIESLIEEAFNNEATGKSKDVLYWNKNKVLSLARNFGLKIPRLPASTPYVHSIHEDDVYVKPNPYYREFIKSQTDTQQFKRWIDGTKIRSKNGAPNALYLVKQTSGGTSYLSANKKYSDHEKMYVNVKHPYVMRLSEDLATKTVDKYATGDANRRQAIAALTSQETSYATLQAYAKYNNMSVKALLEKLGFDGWFDGKTLAAFNKNQIKSADETKNSGLFGQNDSPYWYTEYDADAQAAQSTIENMTADEKRITGDPRLLQTNHGFVVARKVSREGLVTGNPVFNKGETPVAMIAPVSEFPNGDVGKLVPLSKCTALVVPNTYAYAETRTDAREMGVNVYPYNSDDPTAFDRAINRAAQQSNVQFFPNETYDDFLERYGAKKPGAQPRVENRPVPERTSDTNRVSDMVRNAAEAPVTTDDTYKNGIRNWITNGTGTYMPISNAKTLEKARGTIERAGSINQAAADLHRDVANSNGKATDLLARAELLYVEAQDPASGLTELEREEIFGDMCIIASDAGRALQAASLLKNMTAEGHIQYIEQVGKRMSDRYQKRTKERVNLKLTDEEKERYRTAVTEEQRKEIDDEVGKRFSEETSKLTFLDKVRNWRYFSMLGNPRTHFRNIVGNSLMRPVARIKDTINAGLQAAFGVEQADRTTSAWTGRVDAATRAYVEDQLRQALPIMQGVSSKYADEVTKTPTESNDGSLKATLTQEVPTAKLSNGKTRIGRFLNTLSFVNSNALELEDAKALGHRFRSSMYQIIKARGLDVNNISDEQRESIVNYAMEESLRATFRDANALADAINKFARTNRATQFLTEAIIPFKKTPLNIAKRSIEYSPIGLVNGIYKLCSNTPAYNAEIKRIDASNMSEEAKAKDREKATYNAKMQKIAAIDRLSQGLTGSLLTALGLFASSMGWISIGRKDDEEAAFEQGLGQNTYSLNIGDLSIDLSAFAPSAVPMLMGSALYEAFGADRGDGGAFVSDLISVLCESVDPVTEMSMLSGLADAFQGISYAGNEDGGKTRYIGTVIGNAMSSYVGQFIPTFVGQVARVTDPYARSYSAGDDYWASSVFGSEVGSVVKSMQNKIPFLSWLSEPKVDVHGNPVKNYTNWGSYIFHPLNNFILPATIKQDSKNEIDDELVRLYGVVDSADIFPTKPSRNLGAYTDKKTGQKYQFKITNDSEYTQYQMDVGQTVYDMLEDLMQSRAYARMTDEQKAEAIAKVIDQAQSSVKKRWKAQKIAAIGK